MAEQNTEHDTAHEEGFLTSTARTLGHAAGEAAKALGLEHPEGAAPSQGPAKEEPKPKRVAHGSARARRVANATAVKQAATALGKGAFSDDVRYRRTMGKPPAIWSDEDIDYIGGLVSAK